MLFIKFNRLVRFSLFAYFLFRTLQLNPNDVAALNKKGSFLESLGNYDEALD